ncbi:MAG: ABC transporter ATP-binding protein [Chloroflexota bacterium]
MSETVVQVRGLRKSYGEREAVRGIDLDVHRGEIVALLGPNGAGKTTTVEILEGYRGRTAGDVSVLGHDPGAGESAYKARIGIVLQSTGVERYLTTREVITLYGGYYPDPRPTDELLQLVGLVEQADVRVGRLSGGQRRRLDVAVALVGRPELVFLDEPTTGFDPSARRQAWSIIRGLADAGTAVLLTTHFMDEAQALADRLMVIVDGRIVAQGSVAEVIGQTSTDFFVRVKLPAGTPPPDGFELTRDAVDGDWLVGRTPDPTDYLHRLTGWAVAAGVTFDDVAVARPSLEDTYLALTGRSQAEPVEEEAPARGRRRRR